jgi:hypothetical protein
LVVVQDDASFLTVVDPARPAEAVSHPLAAGEGGKRQFDDRRGNKKGKLDLEAAFLHQDRFVALGSGSSPRRERVVVARGLLGEHPTLHEARVPAFYAMLRACTEFSGSELNVEGALVVGDRVRLFQRGNGAPRGDLLPVDATGDVDRDALLAHFEDPTRPCPALEDVTVWDLGQVDGVRLGFTDAALAPSGRVYWLAAAESSPDATRDGPVAGVAIGVMGGVMGGDPRWARVELDGAPWDGKAEGICFVDERSGWLVVDRDDPDAPAELWRFELDGPW